MSFNAGLTRKGPGLLVRDLMRGKDEQISAIIDQIVELKPDILGVQSFDYDHDGVAASLFKDALKAGGHPMSHHFAVLPNTGVPTGFDLDRNGRLGEARDAQGYGFFTGQAGLLLLSRYPILDEHAQDFTQILWRDLSKPRLPEQGGELYFSAEELDLLRLHSVAAFDVPVKTPDGLLHILMSQAGPPVFDGPEDRNGLRNADEITFWDTYINTTAIGNFAVMAGLNNDPHEGEGLKPALNDLLSNPRLIDANPQNHSGSSDTVAWDFGSMRVDYVLPSSTLDVRASGVHWPATEPEGGFGSRHRPVWVDILWK